VSQKADIDAALSHRRLGDFDQWTEEALRVFANVAYDLGMAQGLSDAARAVVRDGYYEQGAELIRRIRAAAKRRRKKVLGV
jgi:hypothetical protein